MNKPQQFLIDAVEQNDLKKIRAALSTYLSKNPTNENKEVTDAVAYVNQHFQGGLWDAPDDRPFEENPSNWSKDYFAGLKSDLRNNFSKQRFVHILSVGQEIYKKKQVSPKQPQAGQSVQVQRPASKNQEQGVIRPQEKPMNWLIPAVVGVGIIAVVYMLMRK